MQSAKFIDFSPCITCDCIYGSLNCRDNKSCSLPRDIGLLCPLGECDPQNSTTHDVSLLGEEYKSFVYKCERPEVVTITTPMTGCKVKKIIINGVEYDIKKMKVSGFKYSIDTSSSAKIEFTCFPYQDEK